MYRDPEKMKALLVEELDNAKAMLETEDGNDPDRLEAMTMRVHSAFAVLRVVLTDNARTESAICSE